MTTLEALQTLLSTGRSDGPLGKDTPIILYVSHSRDSGLEATLQPRLDSAEGWKQLPSASHAVSARIDGGGAGEGTHV